MDYTHIKITFHCCFGNNIRHNSITFIGSVVLVSQYEDASLPVLALF